MTSLEAMSTESLVSPAAETQNPAAATETPDVVTPEAVGDAQDTPEQTEGDSQPDTKALERMQRRIDKRTADVYRERARAEQLAQRLAELEAKSGQSEQPQDKGKTADPVELAKQIARQERFNETADQLVSEGTKKHKDFKDALANLATEVGPFVQNGLPSPFMEAVLEVADDTKQRYELMYHLGKNPEVAEELAGLSPLKLATRLDRIQRELAEASRPKTSSAPKPLAEVRGSANTARSLVDLDGKDFAKRRREQIANRH